MQTELEYMARFPESLYKLLIWDSEEVSASTSLAETINKPAAEFDNIIIIIWLSLNQLCHVYVQLIFFIKNTRSDTQTYSYIIFIIISISIYMYVSDKTACCNEVRVFFIVCPLINWIQIDSNEGQYLIPKS